MQNLKSQTGTKEAKFADAIKPLSGLLVIFGVDILASNDATGIRSPRTVIKWLLRIIILAIIGAKIYDSYQSLIDKDKRKPMIQMLTPSVNIALTDMLFACVCCVTLWVNEKRIRKIFGLMTNQAFPQLEEHRSSYRMVKLITILTVVVAVLLVTMTMWPMIASYNEEKLRFTLIPTSFNPKAILMSLRFWPIFCLSSLFCVLMAVACVIIQLQLQELSSATGNAIRSPKDLEQHYHHAYAMVINVDQVFSSALPFLYMLRCYSFVVMADWFTAPTFKCNLLLILAMHLFQFFCLTIPPTLVNNMLKSPMDVPEVHHVQPAIEGTYNSKYYSETIKLANPTPPKLTAGAGEISTKTWVKVIVCCVIYIWLNYTLLKLQADFIKMLPMENGASDNTKKGGKTINLNKSREKLKGRF